MYILTIDQSRKRILAKLVDLDKNFEPNVAAMLNNWTDLQDRQVYADEEDLLEIPTSDNADVAMEQQDDAIAASDLHQVPEYLR